MGIDWFVRVHNSGAQFSCELKHLVTLVANDSGVWPLRKDEVSICRGHIKRFEARPERMYVEDLAALEHLTEDTILEELRHRTTKGFAYTFIGDVLLAINSNEMPAELPRNVSDGGLCYTEMFLTKR